MATIAQLSNPIIRRAYGDWMTTQLMPWKKLMLALAIKPCQQFRHNRLKNSSDSALIMDAVELLLADKADGFCIVSSDSDYIGLMWLIREANKAVYGFGTSQATQAFRAACDEFLVIESLTSLTVDARA